MLTVRGVAKATAKSLAGEFSFERIQEKVRFVDWLLARGDKRISGNAPGFLVTAIRNDYVMPKDFAKALLGRPNIKPATPSKAMPLPKPEGDQAVQDYLAKLDEAGRKNLEAAAVKAADPLTADGYRRSLKRGGPAFAAYQRLVVERFVREILRAQNAAA